MHMTDNSAERRLLRVTDRARESSDKRLSRKVEAYLKGEPMNSSSAASRPCDGEERRQFNRLAITSEVLVRRIGGFNFQVPLKDVSTAGCRVEMLEPCELEDSVIARFPQLEPLGSRVCWTQGTTTGLQFQTSIHPAVLDMLLTRLSESELAPA